MSREYAEGGNIERTDGSSYSRVVEQLERKQDRPLEVGDPLLEIRRPDVDALVKKIGSSDVTVLGRVARSGSSSIMNEIAHRFEADGFLVVHFDGLTDKTGHDIKGAFLHENTRVAESKDEKKPAIVIVEEAGAFVEYEDMAESFIYDGIEGASRVRRGADVNYVLLGTGSGMDKLAGTLKDKLSEEDIELKVETAQVPAMDRQDLQTLCNTLDRQMTFDEDLRARVGDVLERAYSPQHVISMINRYAKVRADGGSDEQAWAKARVPDEKVLRTLNDTFRTTGGEKLKELVARVHNEGGMSMDSLSDEEKTLLDRNKEYHLLNMTGDQVTVQGTWLGDYAAGTL